MSEYTFSESDGLVQVCTQLSGVTPPLAREYPIVVSFQHNDVTAGMFCRTLQSCMYLGFCSLSNNMQYSVPFPHAEESSDFVFNGIVMSTYSPCSNIGQCEFVDCINIELLDDVDVEGEQEFEIEIISVSLGSTGVPTTTIVLTDTIGE